MKKILIGIFITSILFTLFTVSKASYAYTKNGKSNYELKNNYSNNDDRVSRAIKKERNTGSVILKASGISFIIATIICTIIIYKHKPVKVARTANNYLNESKINITTKEDIFLSSTVDKQLR